MFLFLSLLFNTFSSDRQSSHHVHRLTQLKGCGGCFPSAAFQLEPYICSWFVFACFPNSNMDSLDVIKRFRLFKKTMQCLHEVWKCSAKCSVFMFTRAPAFIVINLTVVRSNHYWAHIHCLPSVMRIIAQTLHNLISCYIAARDPLCVPAELSNLNFSFSSHFGSVSCVFVAFMW